MNKLMFSRQLILVVVVGAFALMANVRVADASDPAASQPATAAYISGLPQSIPANSSVWYKFDYAGDKSQVTVLMPNGANTLTEFNVFTPEQAQSWWDKETKPVGRGTAYAINCDTGEENYMGECTSNDLKWVGQFNFPGTFYVQVVNFNTGTANFTLTVNGTGVHVAPPPAPAPPAPVKPAVVHAPQPMLPVTGGVWWDLLLNPPGTHKIVRE